MKDRTSADIRTIRPGPRAATSNAVPAGQIPADVTAKFLAFITALDAHTTTPADELQIVVRNRATGHVAGTVPVTEDVAIAVLTALHNTAHQVRPTGTAPAECEGEPETQHTRPAWLPDADDAEGTARSVARLRQVLAPAPVQAPVIPAQPQPAEPVGEQRRTVAHATLRVVPTQTPGGAQ